MAAEDYTDARERMAHEQGPAGPEDGDYARPRGEWAPPPRHNLKEKSGGLAGFLSFLLPGLGQVYAGMYPRGFTYAAIFALIVTLLSSSASRGIEPLLGILMGFFYLYNIIDATRCVAAYNMALRGQSRDPALAALPMLGLKGGRLSGWILVALGTVLFLRTKFDFDLDWLEEWWPMGLVAFGVWILWQNRRNDASRA